MDSVLTAAFVLGLPAWLVVEQIFVMLRSPRPAVRPVTTRVAPLRHLPEPLNQVSARS